MEWEARILYPIEIWNATFFFHLKMRASLNTMLVLFQKFYLKFSFCALLATY